MNNLTQRIITAAIAIPIIILICMAGGLYFFLFVAVVSGIALIEFYNLAAAKGAKPLVVMGVIAGFFVNLSFYYPKLHTFVVGWFDSMGMAIPFPSQSQLLGIILILMIVVMCLIELFRGNGSALLNLSTTIMGILYISMFFGTFIGIRELFIVADPPVAHYFVASIGAIDGDAVYRFGGFTVISIFAMIWICDSAAFHFGMSMGKHKLFPRVSPNKSWEGAIFGFIFAIISAIAAKYLVLEYLPIIGAVVIGIIVGTIGQLGDLVESLLKRDAGVKDSSTLIPGHGGAFDRFDSLLLVSPLVYLYLDFILFT